MSQKKKEKKELKTHQLFWHGCTFDKMMNAIRQQIGKNGQWSMFIILRNVCFDFKDENYLDMVTNSPTKNEDFFQLEP